MRAVENAFVGGWIFEEGRGAGRNALVGYIIGVLGG